ncbi:hypothetical protein BU202_00415 [Streptococcus cuniculi]|uniref:Uncharacterized protein n=1 Tax=Streptococcus cuniculi TaxID=1432788 RepID=A0A1Q8EAG1_9STRE|nr:hypothetical protein [Streptococcus cuniculi]OLF48788.1 hypothetical protein BU202_00415 [Streptococcus cuniculi]
MNKQVRNIFVIVLSIIFLVLLGMVMQVPSGKMIAVLACSLAVNGLVLWSAVRSSSSNQARGELPYFGEFVKKTWPFLALALVLIGWNILHQGDIFTRFFYVVVVCLVYTTGFIKTAKR